MPVRCLIVDDEPPAQRILEKYIDDIPFLTLVGKAAHPTEALNWLKSEPIDLVFLDINLPKLSGLHFLKNVNRLPEVIITTAYPEYALEGFELNVLDYLVKPIAFERFLKAVSRLPQSDDTEKRGEGKENEKKREEKKKAINKRPTFTFVKTEGSIYRIDFDDILYVNSDADYVNVQLSNRRHYLRQTLKHWQSLLPGDQFFRVHKSYIVNMARIEEIVGNRIKMEDTVIPIGRNYKNDFLNRIEKLM